MLCPNKEGYVRKRREYAFFGFVGFGFVGIFCDNRDGYGSELEGDSAVAGEADANACREGQGRI